MLYLITNHLFDLEMMVKFSTPLIYIYIYIYRSIYILKDKLDALDCTACACNLYSDRYS